MDNTLLERLYAIYLQASGVNTDTRTLQAGELFFALKGDNFNGNLFAVEALQKGACAVVVDEYSPNLSQVETERVVLVPDTLYYLQKLANRHRKQWAKEIVGLTGSNGKTTTKELIKSVLSTERKVFATPGNRNNHIGLPLSLLQLCNEHELAILEMGDNHPGDIALLCEIAEPTAGLITNIGYDHIGFYGSIEANAAGKKELFTYLIAQQGLIFLNQADPYLQDVKYPANTIRYNYPQTLQVLSLQQTVAGLAIDLLIEGKTTLRLQSSLFGQHNVENIVAATAVGLHYGVAPENIAKGIAAFVPTGNRSERRKIGKFEVILDAYNANPSSMQAAISAFFALGLPAPCLILGDMNELGQHSTALHIDLGNFLNQFQDYTLICIGKEMRATFKATYSARAKCWVEQPHEAVPLLALLLQDRKSIFLKGSRSLKLEHLLSVFLDIQTN